MPASLTACHECDLLLQPVALTLPRSRAHSMLSTLAYSPCEPYGKRVKWRSLSH